MDDIIDIFNSNWFGKPVEYEEATSAVSRENSFVFEFPVNPNLQSYDAVRYSSPTEGTDATSSTTQNAGHQSEASVGDRIEIKCENSSTEDKAMGQSWLGTWARRQKIFGLLAGPSEEKEERQVTAKAGKGKEIKDDSKKINEDFDEGALREQAWKWRFTRKWQMEQANNQTRDAEEDDWMAALRLVNNGGAQLQFGRGSSLEHDSFAAALSQSTASLLAADSSLQIDLDFGSREESLMASKQLNRAVSKAEKLLAYQKQIEEDVANRWRMASEPWVGIFLPAVKIDSWGYFKFILGKVVDKTNRFQKLLLRGNNRHTEHQAVNSVRQEISRESRARNVDWARMDVIGIGELRWLSQKEAKIEIKCLSVFSGLDSMFTSKIDVVKAASAILQSQGAGYRVTMITE